MSDMKEYQPELFELEDENGNKESFELVDVYEEEDAIFYALIPYTENEDEDEEGFFVILRQDKNEADGMLVSIEDEEELDRVGEIFMQRIFADDDECDCCHDDGCDCSHDDSCGCCH